MNDLISIIVPVYNVELYIEKCINSLINQSYKDIEIILVDDGSTDSSGDICDHFSSLDKRITVIHKKNGGLSDARNVALDVAKGKYVTFVDSDDYIKENYIEYLYYLLNKYNSDISICEFDYMNESGMRINHPLDNNKELVFDQKKAMKKLLGQKLFTNSSSGKLFKMIHFSDIRYPYGKLYEDTLTIYKIFLKAKSISFGAKPLYCYIYHDKSISKSEYSPKQMECITNTEIMIEDVLKCHPDLKIDCICRLLDPCVGMLKKVSKDKQINEYKAIIAKILGEKKFVELMRKW